ncbi:MAG: hypothetical protein EHM21_12625 [Chloroflexi bacterium]|nr:MAG: hypothetical protein EHM21_12625 [Chloroflexota bacterium]
MQLDITALGARVSQLEKMVFGHDVPDYVQPPTKDDPFPPIKQAQAKNEDGSGKVDTYNRPVLVDVMVHKPGLLDEMAALKSGTPLAGEGGATSTGAHLAHQAKGKDK